MRRLTSIPGYRLYLTARIAAWIGNVMSLVALPVLIYQLTGSATLTGLLAAAGALPYLILGLPAGALADRWDSRRTMATWSAVAGAAMLSVSAAHALGRLGASHVIATAFVVGTAFVFADAAGFGALPRLVGRDNVGRATASQSAIYTVISIAGPGVAGLLITAIGPAWVVGLDGVGYLVEAVLISRLPLSRAGSRASGRPGPAGRCDGRAAVRLGAPTDPGADPGGARPRDRPGAASSRPCWWSSASSCWVSRTTTAGSACCTWRRPPAASWAACWSPGCSAACGWARSRWAASARPASWSSALP